MADIFQCECGYICRRDDLNYWQSQAERTNCSNDDASPAEYETVCPDCGAMDSFEAVEQDTGDRR